MADLDAISDRMKVIYPNSIFVKMDKVLDYVPIVSTATNLIDIFNKAVAIPLLLEVPYLGDYLNSIPGYSYKWYVQNEKSFLRCFLLLIPILGNLIYGIYDSILASRAWAAKEKEAASALTKESGATSNPTVADTLSLVVVSSNEKKPAEEPVATAQKPAEVVEYQPYTADDLFDNDGKLKDYRYLYGLPPEIDMDWYLGEV